MVKSDTSGKESLVKSDARWYRVIPCDTEWNPVIQSDTRVSLISGHSTGIGDIRQVSNDRVVSNVFVVAPLITWPKFWFYTWLASRLKQFLGTLMRPNVLLASGLDAGLSSGENSHDQSLIEHCLATRLWSAESDEASKFRERIQI